MSNFDIEYGQDLLDKRDYNGYADYLSSFKAKDLRSQQIVNNKIRYYKDLAEKQESTLENCSDEERQAFQYMQGMNGNGRLPGEVIRNQFATDYKKIVDNFTSADGTNIQNFAINFESEDALFKFYNKIGLNQSQLEDNYGIVIQNHSDNGSYSLIISTDNKKLPDVINSIDVNSSFFSEEGERPFYNNFGYVNQHDKEYLDNLKFSNAILDNITAIDSKGKTFDKNGFDSTKIIDLKNIYNRANRIFKSVLDKQETKKFEDRLLEIPFLGEGHRKALEYLKKGIYTNEKYKQMMDIRTDMYNTHLRNITLTDKRVYAAQAKTKDEGMVLREAGNIERLEYDRLISVAMQENRISYTAGMLGGEIGTIITISQELDKNKKFSDNPTQTLTRLFVPGLFSKSAQESFNYSTEGKAIHKQQDMKRWNYSKRLSDGTKIGYNKQMGSYVEQLDNHNRIVRTPVDDSYILNRLNEDNIIQDSVDELFNFFDQNGNLTIEAKNKKEQIDLFNRTVLDLATAGANELYPKSSYSSDERVAERDRIYRELIKALNNRVTKLRKSNER